MQKPSWFRMDPAAFLADGLVDAMSTTELGACFRLLCRQWLDGHIPDDLNILARLCRLDDAAMREASTTVFPFFPVIEPGKRANRFMWLQREKVVADMERRTDEGTRAAKKRWAEKRALDAIPTGLPNEHPMPEPMQDKKRREEKRGEEQHIPFSEPEVYPELTDSSADNAAEGNKNGISDEQTFLVARTQEEDAVRDVWLYYVAELHKNPRLYRWSYERKQKGVARLRECYARAKEPRLENAVAMMKLCVDRLAASDFHNGTNKNGKKYTDWSDHLFPSEKKLEWWLDDDVHGSRSASTNIQAALQ